MRLGFFAAAMALIAVLGAPKAEARPYYEETGYNVQAWGSSQGSDYRRTDYRRHSGVRRTAGSRHNKSYRRSYSSSRGVGARPGRWCGWWMRTQLGGGPEYNLARNWRNWGRSSGPQVGAVVVWPHHVGMITGRSASGQWIVKSGNDGGRVRERARSVSGATFRVG